MGMIIRNTKLFHKTIDCALFPLLHPPHYSAISRTTTPLSYAQTRATKLD